MIPLQLTDTALNTSSTAGKTGKVQREGDGAFAAMFDQTRPANDGSSAPSEEAVAEPVLTADVDTDETEEEVPIAVEVDDVALAVVTPAVSAEGSDGGDIIALTASKPGVEQPQSGEADEASTVQVARAAPKGSLAQSMVEGRFPSIASTAQPDTGEKGATASIVSHAEIVAKEKLAAVSVAPVGQERAVAPTAVIGEPGRASPAIPETTKSAGSAVPAAAQQALSRIQGLQNKPALDADSIGQDESRGRGTIRGELAAATTSTPSASTPTPPAATTAIPPAVAAGGAAAAKTDLIDPGKVSVTSLDPLSEVSAGFGSSERVSAGIPQATVTAAPTTAGIETARHVAGQISVAVSGPGGRATEISLSPEELGRVRLHMTAVDQTITLHVMAERPETNDLLRRHIDVLAQEFRALGYEDIAFSFGDGASANTAGAEGDEGHDGHQPAIRVAEPEVKLIQTSGPQSGLDLRL